MPPEVNTNVSQSLRVQTPIDLNAATTLMGRFATSISPVSLRSSSSLSENSSSESTSRNSSIFFSSFFQSRVTKLSRHNHTSIGYSNWRPPLFDTNGINMTGCTKPRSKTINYTMHHFLAYTHPICSLLINYLRFHQIRKTICLWTKILL